MAELSVDTMDWFPKSPSEVHVFSVPDTTKSEVLRAFAYEMDEEEVSVILGITAASNKRYYMMDKHIVCNSNDIMEYINRAYNMIYYPTDIDHIEYVDQCREDYEYDTSSRPQDELDPSFCGCQEDYEYDSYYIEQEYWSDNTRDYWEDALQEDVLAQEAALKVKVFRAKCAAMWSELEDIDATLSECLEKAFGPPS